MLYNLKKGLASKLSLGGAALGSCREKVFFGKTVNDQEAINTVLYAIDNGINLIDTSPFYGDSERKIGLALREYGKREDIIISTKAGTHPELRGYSPEIIQRSIENSLTMMKTDYLDIVHIHDPGIKDFELLLEDNGAIDLLTELRYKGVIRYIGLGVRDHKIHNQFIESGFADVILPYLDYNLLSQTAEGLLQMAHQKNIAVLLGSPLCMGLLSGKDPRELNVSHFNIENEVPFNLAIEMYEYCKENKLNLMTLNFQFILENNAITSILTGASSVKELEEVMQSFNEKINPEALHVFCERFHLVHKKLNPASL